MGSISLLPSIGTPKGGPLSFNSTKYELRARHSFLATFLSQDSLMYMSLCRKRWLRVVLEVGFLQFTKNMSAVWEWKKLYCVWRWSDSNADKPQSAKAVLCFSLRFPFQLCDNCCPSSLCNKAKWHRVGAAWKGSKSLGKAKCMVESSSCFLLLQAEWMSKRTYFWARKAFLMKWNLPSASFQGVSVMPRENSQPGGSGGKRC